MSQSSNLLACPHILTTIFHQSPQVSTSFHGLIPINHRQLQLQLTSATTWTSACCEHLARPCGSLRKLLAARCSLHAAARTQWLISISPPLPHFKLPSYVPRRHHLKKIAPKQNNNKASEHCVNLWARTYREGTLRKTACLSACLWLLPWQQLSHLQISVR